MMPAQQQIDDYGPEHSEKIAEWGEEMQKVGTTFIFQPGNSGKVRTNEGELTYGPSDFIATDPKTGHVWPVAGYYVKENYRPVEATIAAAPISSDYRREQALSHAIHAKKNGLAASMTITELAEQFFEFLTR